MGRNNRNVTGGSLQPIGQVGKKKYYKVDANNPNKTDSVIIGNKLAVDNGEILEVNGNTIRVNSNDMGTTKLMGQLARVNDIDKAFDMAYNTQEQFKDRIGLNDDGTRKALLGGKSSLLLFPRRGNNHSDLTLLRRLNLLVTNRGKKDNFIKSDYISKKRGGGNEYNVRLNEYDLQRKGKDAKVDFSGIKTTRNRPYNPEYISIINDSLLQGNLTDYQRASILANIIEESGGNPFADSGTGFYGLLQWGKDRYKYNGEKDVYKELKNQSDYIISTMNNIDDKVSWTYGGRGSGYKSYKDAMAAFNGDDADKVMHGYTWGYVRPAGKQASYNNRTNVYNQLLNLEGFKTGGIYIKPSKRGTFTAAAKQHGKSVQEFASQVLNNKENYSSSMVKKANFARNASKWHRVLGGINSLMYGGKSSFNPISSTGGLKKAALGTKITLEDVIQQEIMSKLIEGLKNTKGSMYFTPDQWKKIRENITANVDKTRVTKGINDNGKVYPADNQIFQEDFAINPLSKGKDIKDIIRTSIEQTLGYKPTSDTLNNVIDSLNVSNIADSLNTQSIITSPVISYGKGLNRDVKNSISKVFDGVSNVNIPAPIDIQSIISSTGTKSVPRGTSSNNKSHAEVMADKFLRRAKAMEEGSIIKNNLKDILVVEQNRALNTQGLTKLEGEVPQYKPTFAQSLKLFNARTKEWFNNKAKPWLNNPKTQLGIQTTADLIGNVGDWIQNNVAINRLQAPRTPQPISATKLLTDIDTNATRTAIANSAAKAREYASNNTASSAVKQARLRNVGSQELENTQKVNEQEVNAETQLINQDRMNQQQVGMYNTMQYNKYLNDKTAFENQKLLMRAQNTSNAINAAAQTLAGLTQGLSGVNATSAKYPQGSTVAKLTDFERQLNAGKYAPRNYRFTGLTGTPSSLFGYRCGGKKKIRRK